MERLALRAAKWLLEKYVPDHHVHANPKIRKEKPPLQSREEYMAWRQKARNSPDPKDFEDPAEFQHEMEKFVMKAEAQMEGDR